MNGDIEQQDDSTPRQFQRAAYVISPFMISAVCTFIFPLSLLPFLYAIPSGARQLRVIFLTTSHNTSQFMWEM